eukprot:scaffold3464_cov406-Prasinococcus_capsulatus_cf.AAC.7
MSRTSLQTAPGREALHFAPRPMRTTLYVSERSAAARRHCHARRDRRGLGGGCRAPAHVEMPARGGLFPATNRTGSGGPRAFHCGAPAALRGPPPRGGDGHPAARNPRHDDGDGDDECGPLGRIHDEDDYYYYDDDDDCYLDDGRSSGVRPDDRMPQWSHSLPDGPPSERGRGQAQHLDAPTITLI